MRSRSKTGEDIALKHARELRSSETNSEQLLWSMLRGSQLCGLKFRRQHPIDPFIADFVCIKHKLVVEIDGGYHNYTFAEDQTREAHLRKQGWQVFRVTSMQVEENPYGVGMMIAEHLGLEFKFRKRNGTGSGAFYKRKTND